MERYMKITSASEIERGAAMNMTFAEWKLIEQAVQNWKENSEKHMQDSKPSEERTSCFQIFKRQTIELTALHEKILNSVI